MIQNIFALAISAYTATKTMAVDFIVSDKLVLSERSYSLKNRYPVKSVSDVFKDNILLTLSYLDGKVESRGIIDWSLVDKPQTYSFTLQPGETFAFHNDVLPEYEGKVVKTTDAHFNGSDGFKSDGYLMGDGVCHLASFIYWAARDAGLATVAPTNHNFANIPEVPKQYGVSIYQSADAKGSSARQNLYITNTFNKTVTFDFAYDGTNLDVKVES